MLKCWLHKAGDRPTFATLVKSMETALHKQCPDTALIPLYEGEVLPRTKARMPSLSDDAPKFPAPPPPCGPPVPARKPNKPPNIPVPYAGMPRAGPSSPPARSPLYPTSPRPLSGPQSPTQRSPRSPISPQPLQPTSPRLVGYVSIQAYRKTPNKRPWAFANYRVRKRAFPPFSSFLRNDNRTIFD